MANDIVLTGPPRSGTTLACHLLNKVDDTVALHEPMNLKMFPDVPGGISQVRSFFTEMRASLVHDNTAISKAIQGVIPTNSFEDDSDSVRESLVKRGDVKFDKELSGDFRLIIKYNIHFTFMLPELANYFPVYAIIRHPVATIASWNSVDAPVASGNAKVLRTLNPELYRNLEAIPDLLERQVALLDHMYRFYASISKVQFITYEEMISSQGRVLAGISPSAASLSDELENRNSSPIYNQQLIEKIRLVLLKRKGAYLDLYPESEIVNF